MTSELLNALTEVDEGTICFLLDTLASFQEEDCDWEEEVVPLVESLVEDASTAATALEVLKSDPEAVAKAKTALHPEEEAPPPYMHRRPLFRTCASSANQKIRRACRPVVPGK